MATKLTKIVANFQAQLSAKLIVGGTSINISTATDKDSVPLPAGKYCFVAEPGKSNEEHLIGDLSGTALTNIQSVSRQGVKTTGALKEHRVGAVIKLTDFVNLKVLVDMLSGAESLDGSSPLAYDAEPTINDRKQLATAGYVQDVASGAIGTANPTAAGTVRTTADQGANPRAMSTLVRQQTTPDMTLHVEAFKHAEIDKVLSFAGGNSAAFINPGLAGDLALALNPSNGETFTLTINGTACLFNFVSSIGSTVGNVLIGASAAETRANLTAFINNPGATSTKQVGFTGAQLTALGLVSATDDLSLNMFVRAISATVTTLAGDETMAGVGNVWTANTTKNRIDLLVLQTSDSTLQIRRGTEAASPVAPTPTSGDIVLAQVYCKIGMASVKDVTDGTNGYIAAWYFPQVFRTDVLTSASTSVKQYPTIPAGENISAGNLLKAINDSGVAKIKKIIGIGSNITAAQTILASSTNFQFVFIDTNKIAIAYYENGTSMYLRVGTISGSVLTLGTAVTVNTYSRTPDGYQSFKLLKVATDNFIVCYGYTNGSNSAKTYATACTVSGTTITKGSEVELGTEATSVRPKVNMIELSSGKFIISSLRQNGNIYDIAVSVSGSTITAGSPVQVATNSYKMEIVKLTSSTYLHTWTYNSTYASYKVNSVSGTTITQGTDRQYNGSSYNIVSRSLVNIEDNKCLHAYYLNGASTTLYLAFITVSGDTLTIVNTITITGAPTITDHLQQYKIIKHLSFAYVFYGTTSRIIKIAFDNLGAISVIKDITSVSFSFTNGQIVVENGDSLFFCTNSDTTLPTFINILLDHDEFLTAANSSYLTGDNVVITDLFTSFSSLSVGADYYINAAATGLTISNAYQKIGKAIAADKILK